MYTICMKQNFDTLPIDHDLTNESIEPKVFSEWCKMFDVDVTEIPPNLKSPEKVALYDSVFRLGARKFMEGFLAQMETNRFDLSVMKSELDVLRREGDVVALRRIEQEIALTFQQAISAYKYEGTTVHPREILARKEMNCVGASLIGGMLLDEVGIRFLLAEAGSHAFLIMVTSDDRVFWQDMQDGKEKPELNNQELTSEKISGTDAQGVSIVPFDIVAFAHSPNNEGMNFIVNIENWKGVPAVVAPFASKIFEHELVNTGFMFTNTGRHKESEEIFRIALLKSPTIATPKQIPNFHTDTL